MALEYRKVPGSIILGILAVTALSIALGLSPFGGVFATAPALCYVAVLMTRGLAEIDWDDLTESAPAVMTALAMPFTFSIAYGFISYAALKLLTGRFAELKPAVLVIAGLWIFKGSV